MDHSNAYYESIQTIACFADSSISDLIKPRYEKELRMLMLEVEGIDLEEDDIELIREFFKEQGH